MMSIKPKTIDFNGSCRMRFQNTARSPQMSVGLPIWSHLLLPAAMNSKAGLMTGKIWQKYLPAALNWGMLSISSVNAWRSL